MRRRESNLTPTADLCGRGVAEGWIGMIILPGAIGEENCGEKLKEDIQNQ